MSTSLTFQSTQFDVIDRNGQPWLRGYQIGSALGYARPDVQITKIFKQHSDEFTDSMTAIITLPTAGGPQETRIFSLRGCHLIAMFARTKVAKEFRVWVLDVLESLNNPQPLLDRLSTAKDPERKELTAMINAWVGVAPIHYAGARAIVNAHIGVKSVDDMTVTQVKQAIAFVNGKISEAGQGQQALPEQPALPARQDLWKTLLPLFNQIHESIGQMEDAAYEILATMDNYTKGIVFHPRKLESVPHHLVINARESMVCTLNSLESTTRAFKNDVWMLESAAKHYWRTGNRIN